ncbi:MAG TPA: AMP-binding protein [Xanthobacteraceae bacterium]|nr:AMP-binding protein [Xanthobacteraceae bacterium]
MPLLLQRTGELASPYDALKAQAVRPDAVFLRAPASAELSYAPDGFAYSYGEALARVEALRAGYAAAGYGHGACVALLMENRPEFFWHWLALNALGVAIMPINPELRADDLAYQLSIAEPDLAVALAETHALIRAASGSARIVAPDETPPRCRVRVMRQSAERDDACALLFTSGTTAKPKCCALSNDYFLRIAEWYVTQGGEAAMGERETVLTPLPMFHMNALGCTVVGMLLTGGAVVPLDRFHARRWWRTVADSGATVIHYLGVMPAILLQLETEDADTTHSVRFGFGAGVDPRHQENFERRFGFPLIEAWAMTETGAGAVTSTVGGPRHVGQRCIGRAGPDMDYRIVDDAGADVARGTAGELLVRQKGDAPRRGFFTEYLKDEAATHEAWEGGWFHTGDVVSEGDDRSLFFVDRKKNIVRRSGENIAVIEVEGVLANLDGIAGVAVAPVPDETRGEEVFAMIVPRDPPRDPRAAAEEIARACAQRLAYFKVPGHVAFVDTIPITPTQKLQRGAIKTLAAAAVGAPGTIDLRAFKATLRQRERSA